jgi:alkylation response protein AidB-like acyl-CoA dehydrogenase
MDFSLNEIQSMLSDSVEKFVSNDYGFENRQKYAASELGYSPDVWQTFADLGWTAVPFSEADGGFDGGPVEMMVMMRQFGRGLVVEPYLENVVLAGGVLRRAANEPQKAKWLAPLIGGELQAALAFTEPQSGYDFANVESTAVKNDDGWLIDGKKGVVLNGGNAGLLIIPAVTKDGISLFAVGGHAEGVVRRSYPTVDGHQAAEIELKNVQVDADAVLGAPGDAHAVLDKVLDEATLAVCAEAVGIMQILTDKTVEYSKNRVQFGVPIGSFQALQHRMVDMLTACEQSYSLLIWAAMTAADGSDEAKQALSAVKYHVGTAGKKVGQEAVQIHGGMGVSWDLDIAHYFKRLTVIGSLFGNADWHLDKLAL